MLLFYETQYSVAIFADEEHPVSGHVGCMLAWYYR